MQREGNPTNRLVGGMTIGIPLILVLASAGCTSGGAHSGSSTNEVGPGTGSTVTPPPSPAGPGGLIVLRRNPDDSAFTIYTVRPDGTALTQLTHPPEGDNDTHPWLSPDGSQVVFERSVNANASSSTNPEHDTLMVINTDGTGLHQLIPACRGACSRACALAKLPCPGDNYPAWSPDGTRIAFERAYGPNLRHLTVAIWVANADGSDARQLTQPKPASEDHSPNWSPNGRRIVFNRFDDSAPNGGQGTIYTIGADDKDLRLVYRAPSRWPFGASQPRWSPDGTRILFSEFCWIASEDCPADTPTTGAHLFTIRPDGTGLTQLTHGSMNELFPTWSPDGRWIVFSQTSGFGDSDGSPDLYLMRANGTDVRPIVFSGCPCLGVWGSQPLNQPSPAG